MIEKINELINEIPEELLDCFAVEIKHEDAIKLEEEILKSYGKMKDFQFPITFRNIPVVIGSSYNPILRVLENYNCVNKVYLYELNHFNNFIKELEKISKKYKCYIGGCGCCGSPSINNLYTLYINDINAYENKIVYDLEIKNKYKEILKESDVDE